MLDRRLTLDAYVLIVFTSVEEPLSTGSVFDIVYRTIANAGAKPAAVALWARLTSKRP